MVQAQQTNVKANKPTEPNRLARGQISGTNRKLTFSKYLNWPSGTRKSDILSLEHVVTVVSESKLDVVAVRKLFTEMDVYGDGFLTPDEITKCMWKRGVTDITQARVASMSALFAKAKPGHLQIQIQIQFTEDCARCRSQHVARRELLYLYLYLYLGT